MGYLTDDYYLNPGHPLPGYVIPFTWIFDYLWDHLGPLFHAAGLFATALFLH